MLSDCLQLGCLVVQLASGKGMLVVCVVNMRLLEMVLCPSVVCLEEPLVLSRMFLAPRTSGSVCRSSELRGVKRGACGLLV